MKKKLKKELKDYKILIVLLGLFPFGIYLLFFNNTTFRIDSEKWAHFGDFIGGFGAVIFGAANLYFLIKLSYKLSQIDDDRNTKNKIDSVKPLGIVNYEVDYNNLSYKIVINNFGLGPLVVKNYLIKYEEIHYKNFKELHEKVSLFMLSNVLLKSIENNKFFVGSNSNHVILEVSFNRNYHSELKNLSGTGKNDLNRYIKNMKSVELTFECEDVLGNVTEILLE
ncbi:hypothetical protein [Empedobacter brevis]